MSARRMRLAGALALLAVAGAARAQTFAPLAPLSTATDPAALRAARQIVVALSSPPPGAGAEAARATAARLADRFAALGVMRLGALADALPAPLPAAGSNPFGFDPSRVMLFEAPDPGSAGAALASLADDPSVEWAEPNQIRAPMGWIAPTARRATPRGGGTPPDPVIPAFPDDPLFRAGKQWALFNLGPAGYFRGVARADIHAPEGWSFTTGSNDLVLAIADTGIDPNHPDLAGTMPDGSPRLFDPIDITGLDPASAFADSFGHGTGVVGAMAARTNNGASVDTMGLAGVCGGDGRSNAGCRIVAIKITPGNSGFATSYDIAQALLYAAAHGARAMNLSFAGTEPSRVERLAMYEAITHGCVPVIAAGNSGYSDGTTAQYPSAYSVDGLGIQVGASDESDQRTIFSSYGPGLDLLAPGTDVYTTFMTYPSHAGVSWPGYIPYSGTSIAAPLVTGAVGLLAAARPELIENDFQRVIDESADDIGAPGVDSLTGWGRLDLGNALSAVGPGAGIWHGTAAGTLGAVVGTDQLTIDESGPGVVDHGRSWSSADQIEVTATVALPDSFIPPVRIWPRVGGTFTVRGGFHLPYFAPWAEVESRTATTFTLRGYLYRRADGCTDCEYIPVPPEQATFGFTVIGRVDRPPAVRITSPAAGTTVSPGDTITVTFVASDPDTITEINVLLSGTSAAGATLPGGVRSVRLPVPCMGRMESPAILTVTAIDGHGPRVDQGSASIPLTVRGGSCVTAARPLSVAPNPVFGAARIQGAAGAEVLIVDLMGRRVRRAILDAGSGAWTWDGRDDRGRRTPPGVYLVRMPFAGRMEERRLVRLE